MREDTGKELFVQMYKLRYYTDKLKTCEVELAEANFKLSSFLAHKLHLEVIHGIDLH